MKVRILSALLVLCMVLTMVPAVGAYDQWIEDADGNTAITAVYYNADGTKLDTLYFNNEGNDDYADPVETRDHVWDVLAVVYGYSNLAGTTRVEITLQKDITLEDTTILVYNGLEVLIKSKEGESHTIQSTLTGTVAPAEGGANVPGMDAVSVVAGGSLTLENVTLNVSKAADGTGDNLTQGLYVDGSLTLDNAAIEVDGLSNGINGGNDGSSVTATGTSSVEISNVDGVGIRTQSASFAGSAAVTLDSIGAHGISVSNLNVSDTAKVSVTDAALTGVYASGEVSLADSAEVELENCYNTTDPEQQAYNYSAFTLAGSASLAVGSEASVTLTAGAGSGDNEKNTIQFGTGAVEVAGSVTLPASGGDSGTVVAMYDGAPYTSLEEALSAAESGTEKTVTLVGAVDITAAIPEGVTVLVPDGVTGNIQVAAIATVLGGSQGTVRVNQGGTLRLPTGAQGALEAFVGETDDARLNLTEGYVLFDIGQRKVTLTAGSEGTIPEGKEFNLLMNTAIGNEYRVGLTAAIEAGATLTAIGTLNIPSLDNDTGTGDNAGCLVVCGTVEASTGTLDLGHYATVTVEDGGTLDLEPAYTGSLPSIVLTNHILGDVTINAGGTLSFMNEALVAETGDLVLSEGASLTIDMGAFTGLGSSFDLILNGEAVIPNGNRFTTLFGDAGLGDNRVKMNLTINEGATLKVNSSGDGNPSNPQYGFRVAQGTTLTLNGTIDVANGAVMDINTANAVTGSGTITTDGTVNYSGTTATIAGGITLTENGRVNSATMNIADQLTSAQEEDTPPAGYTYSWTYQTPAAALSNLTVTEYTLTPDFNSATYEYEVEVAYDETSLTVTPTAAVGSVSSVTLNNETVSVNSDGTSYTATLVDSTNTIVITVTNGNATQSYTINVTREDAPVAQLSGLTVSAGTLAPTFSPDVTEYTVSVENAVDTITVIPTAAAGTITVDDTPVTSDTASAPIALVVGENTIEIVVNNNGITETYTIAVTREEPNQYLITASVTNPAGGSVAVDPATVAAGGTATVTITVNDGWHIGTVTDNGSDETDSVSGGTYTISNVQEDHAIEVTFAADEPNPEPVPETHNVTLTASEGGTVTAGSYTVSNDTTTFSVTDGTVVTFTATADENYTLASAYLNGADVTLLLADGAAYPYTVTGDVELVASFAAVEPTPDPDPDEPSTPSGGGGGGGVGRYAISVADTAHGSISLDRETAAYGTVVTITVRPDAGYELGTLTVTDRNGNEIEVTHEGGSEYSFRMPNGRVTIEATFVPSSGGTGLPFTDVSTGDWFYEAVRYVYENGLMNGTTETTFAPNATTTRGMIVTILYRLEGEPAVSGGSFTDVVSGAYYADAIAWAAANGIVTGYGDGRFGPNDTITREQMATILYRYAAYKGYSVTSSGSLSGYGDAAQVSAYAEEAMAWANGANLVTGTTATTLSPQGSATRVQVATILMRFAGSFAR